MHVSPVYEPEDTEPRRPWLLALVLAALAASLVLATAAPSLVPVTKVASVSAQVQTPFRVEVSDGFRNRVLPWNAGPIRKNDGSPAANLTMVNTVIRPNGSTVVFEQRTDAGGLLRGQLYASILDQVGTYTLKVHVAGGGPFETDTFTLTDPIDLSGNNTFQGDVDVQGALTGTTASFTGALTAASLSGDGSGLTALAADSISTGTLPDARLSSNVALLNATNTFTQSQAISNAGGKTTLQLSNTGADTGLTIGGDANLYRESAGVLATDDALNVYDGIYVQGGGNGSIVSNQGVTADPLALSYVGAEAEPRLKIESGGHHFWGDGTGAPDTNLYRGAANRLQTDDDLHIGDDLTVYDTLFLSSGQDVNLYRSAPDVLATDDTLAVDTVQPNGASVLSLSGDNGGVDINIDANSTGVDELTVNSGFGSNILTIDSADGSAIFQNTTDSVDAFRVNDDGGTARFVVDTTDGSGALVDISGALNVDTTTSADFTIDNDSSASNQFSINSGFGVNLFNVSSNTGRAYFKNTADSATAFQVQNAAGTAILNVDTSGNEVELDTSGKLVVGGDANLYRGGADELKTDDSFWAAGTLTAGYDPSAVTGAAAAFNGNVGIGETSPNHALVVGSGSFFKVDDSFGHIIQHNTNSNTLGDAVPDYWTLATRDDGDYSIATQTTDPGASIILSSKDVVTISPAGSSTFTGTATNPGAFNRKTNDGTIVSLQQAGVEEGTISVSGTTVSYNAFTGSHYARTSGRIEPGMLVSLTGENGRLDGRADAEVVYGVERTAKANDPAVLGSYLSVLEPENEDGSSRPEGDGNPSLVAAVGNGEAWIVDTGEDLLPGDSLVSSETSGHAMKDPGTYERSHVIGKVAERVDWSGVDEVVDGKKHKKVSILFGAYDVGSGDGIGSRSEARGVSGTAGVNDLVAVALLTALGIEGLRLLTRAVRRRRLAGR